MSVIAITVPSCNRAANLASSKGLHINLLKHRRNPESFLKAIVNKYKYNVQLIYNY